MRLFLPELLLAVLALMLVYSTWRQQMSRTLVGIVACAPFASAALMGIYLYQADHVSSGAAEITLGLLVLLKLSALFIALNLVRALKKSPNSVALGAVAFMLPLMALSTMWDTLLLLAGYVYSHGGG
jgi:hypothetical protein